MPSLAELRSYALTRSLSTKTDLLGTIQSLGYVQADPIRSPARAQDLILMQRVRGYKAGDLEKHYSALGIEEDMLHNYGFVPREVQQLVHPRHIESLRIEREIPELAEKVLEFVRERGSVHPRELDAHFTHGPVGNAWGGTSNATTRALDGLHYRGKLRIVRRDKGIRVYAVAEHLELRQEGLSREEQARGLVQLLLKQYAPLPVQSLGQLVSLLGYGAPHLKTEVRAALKNIEAQKVRVDSFTYLWPEGENIEGELPRKVRFVAPFDPLVWDRRRFEHLHGWEYKFEAYTPAAKRRFGYYALPLLWGTEAIGWANLKVEGGELKSKIGFVNEAPKSKTFARELEAELERYRVFLGLIR
ncbi:winged helix-turn-helix domain-containing protein [bacterium]|nr:MAG: winged helix-turn-helix domain-containing protein [bacterium]